MRQLRGLATTLLVATAASSALGQGFQDVHFDQAQNQDAPPHTIDWIGSILNASMTTYTEGMSSPQRLIFRNVASNPAGVPIANVHTLTFNLDSTRGSVHAYDFPTSWDQAIAAADALVPGAMLLTNIVPQRCDDLVMGDGGLADICDCAHGDPLSLPPVDPTVAPCDSFMEEATWPDALPALLGDSIASRITEYETLFGDRILRIWSNQPFAGTPTIAFNGYSGVNNQANYALTWESAPTEGVLNVVVEFAAHIAVSGDGTGVGYGPGLGASNINGGSYHVGLDLLDGVSLGSMDNQIQAGAVDPLPVPGACVLGDPGDACGSEVSVPLMDISAFEVFATYTFEITQNTAPVAAVLTPDPLDPQKATVVTGSPGTIEVTLTKTNADGVAGMPCTVLFDVLEPVSAAPFGDQNACPGDTVVFTTAASGSGPFTFSWSKDGEPFPGARPSLVLSDVQRDDSGVYCVEVTGPCGPPAVQCATLDVGTNVRGRPLTSVTACIGEEATFSVQAAGTGPLVYSWTKDGAPIPGADGPTLTIPSVASGDEAFYCVEVSGECGAPFVSCARLRVNEDTASTPLEPLCICRGETAVFATTTTGTGPFSYTWTRNGDVIVGAVDPSITMANARPEVDGEYCVLVTGPCGEPVLSCALLEVKDPVKVAPIKSENACEGDDVSFTAETAGTGPLAYAWTKDGVPIPGADGPTLSIVAVTAQDEALYCVEVTGMCGGPATSCAALRLDDPVESTPLQPVSVCRGETIELATTARGTGPFTFVWTQDGEVLPAAGPSLTIHNARPAHAGEYCVEVTGACGDPVVSCALVEVDEPVGAKPLKSLNVCPGDGAGFSTEASGSGPFAYAWTKDGVPIAGADGPELSIVEVEPADQGIYCVEVSGACGDPAVRCAGLRVDVPPSAGELLPAEHCTGETAGFSAAPTGTGPFSYVWTHDGEPIPGESGPTLTIVDVQDDDAGTYCVEVTGACEPPASACATLTLVECMQIACTLTQEFYSCRGDRFNGRTAQEMLAELLQEPLSVGLQGARSLTLSAETGDCLCERLPAEETPLPLPDFQDQTLARPACQTFFAQPLDIDGAFVNSLLGETIALTLNTRLDPRLADRSVCNVMTTQILSPGPDGFLGTSDDVDDPGFDGLSGTDDDLRTVSIPLQVTGALDALGLGRTVRGVLALANIALSGSSDLGGADFDEIFYATRAINRVLEGCRRSVDCFDLAPDRFLVVGGSEGDADFTLGERTARTQLDSIHAHYPVPSSGGPAFLLPDPALPADSALPGRFAAQVVSLEDERAFSEVLTIDVAADGRFTVQRSGNGGGIAVSVESKLDVRGRRSLVFTSARD